MFVMNSKFMFRVVLPVVLSLAILEALLPLLLLTSLLYLSNEQSRIANRFHSAINFAMMQ